MWAIQAQTPNDAYQAVLRQLLNSPEFLCSPRGQPCYEVRNAMVEVLTPTQGPITTANAERNAKIRGYTKAELELYDRGENSVEAFAKAATFWKEIGNPDGTVNSAYGRIIQFDRTIGEVKRCQRCNRTGQLQMLSGIRSCDTCKGEGRFSECTPWEWARESLRRDVDTRQAILLFLRPDHLRKCKDVVCTMHGNFHIREGKLHLTVVMRSNDVVKGTVYDVPYFVHLLHRMSDEVSVPVGTYTHIAESLHLYQRDEELARSMIHE